MRNERGSALLLALFVVVTGTLVAIGVLGAASASYKRSIQDTNRQRLRNIAEAGLEQLRFALAKTKTLTVSDSGSVDGGSFSAATTVVDATTGVVDAAITATLSGQTLVLTRRIGCGYHIPRPFDYALAKSSTDADGNVIVTGASNTLGDVRVNGSLRWGPQVCTVNGDILVTGSVLGTIPLYSGTLALGAPSLNFVSPDFNALAIAADQTLASGASIAGITFQKSNELVYCGGNLTMSAGTVTGSGTLVVNGRLTITGGVTYANASAKLAVVALDVQVNTSLSVTINGYFYCPDGDFSANQVTTVLGGVACKTLSNNKNMNITLDPTLRDDPDLGYQMRLPGY